MIIPVPAPLPQKPSIPGAVYFNFLEGGSPGGFRVTGVNFQEVVRFVVGKWISNDGFQCASMDFLTFALLFFLRYLFWWFFLMLCLDLQLTAFGPAKKKTPTLPRKITHDDGSDDHQ